MILILLMLGCEKRLGVTVEKPSFQNPASPGSDVHVFADAPHLLNLVRNHFFDQGFQVDSNINVNRECVREIIRSVQLRAYDSSPPLPQPWWCFIWQHC